MKAHPSQSTNFIRGSPIGRTEQLPPMSGRDKGKRERTFSKPKAAIVHPPHLEHWILTEAAPRSEEGDREQCRHQLGGKIFPHQHYGDSWKAAIIFPGHKLAGVETGASIVDLTESQAFPLSCVGQTRDVKLSNPYNTTDTHPL